MISKKKFIKNTTMIVLCFGITSPAYGYIDPGTGSLLIQSIIGAIAAIGVTMKLYWHKIKVFFMGHKKSDVITASEDEARHEDQ